MIGLCQGQADEDFDRTELMSKHARYWWSDTGAGTRWFFNGDEAWQRVRKDGVDCWQNRSTGVCGRIIQDILPTINSEEQTASTSGAVATTNEDWIDNWNKPLQEIARRMTSSSTPDVLCLNCSRSLSEELVAFVRHVCITRGSTMPELHERWRAFNRGSDPDPCSLSSDTLLKFVCAAMNADPVRFHEGRKRPCMPSKGTHAHAQSRTRAQSIQVPGN